jgi:hypothetical protein
MNAMYIRNIDKAEMPGDARLYELDEPIAWSKWEGNEEVDYRTEFVVVSGIANSFSTETYIFPANAYGKILSWLELDGSFRGSVDHERALENAGYEVIHG